MSLLVMILIAANVIVSLIGFQNPTFFNRYTFSIKGIIQDKQFDRILVSTFLHVDLVHLLFNMFSFFSFAIHIEQEIGRFFLFVLFFGSAILGDLLAFMIHRKHLKYSAAGASGAISGVIFSSVLFFPNSSIMVFPVPFGIPPWLFAIIFVLVSIYGIGRQAGNIGHEAHLGGALAGVLITGLFYPNLIENQLILTMVLVIPVIVFLILFLLRPDILHVQYQKKLYKKMNKNISKNSSKKR